MNDIVFDQAIVMFEYSSARIGPDLRCREQSLAMSRVAKTPDCRPSRRAIVSREVTFDGKYDVRNL